MPAKPCQQLSAVPPCRCPANACAAPQQWLAASRLPCRRPSLLSPALPRLPGGGGGGLGLAPTEPCPAPGEYGQPPPPITCDPLPPEVAAKLAAGEGMAVALEGHSKHSQLEWCLEQAAAAARLQRRHPAEAQQVGMRAAGSC